MVRVLGVSWVSALPAWDGLTTGGLRFTFGLDNSRVRQVYNSAQLREPVVRSPSW